MGDRLGIHGVVHILESTWAHFCTVCPVRLAQVRWLGAWIFEDVDSLTFHQTFEQQSVVWTGQFVQRQCSGAIHDLADGHTCSLSKRPGFNAWNYTLRGVYQFLDLTLRSWCLSEGSKKNRSRCLIRIEWLFCVLENRPIATLNLCHVWTRCQVCTVILARHCIFVYDHTMLKAPVLVWSLQLSNIGPC